MRPKITCVNIKVCVSILQKVQQNCSTFHFLPLPVKSKVYELVLRLWYWGRTNFPASTGVVQMWAGCRFWRPIWPNYKARWDSFSTIFRHFSCANSWHEYWNICNNSGSICIVQISEESCSISPDMFVSKYVMQRKPVVLKVASTISSICKHV